MDDRTPQDGWQPSENYVLSEAFAAAMATADGTFAERETRALRVANELVRDWLGAELAQVARDDASTSSVTQRTASLEAA